MPKGVKDVGKFSHSKKLSHIEKRTMIIGDKLCDVFEETGSLQAQRAANYTFNSCMRSMRYQMLYCSAEPEKEIEV